MQSSVVPEIFIPKLRRSQDPTSLELQVLRFPLNPGHKRALHVLTMLIEIIKLG